MDAQRLVAPEVVEVLRRVAVQYGVRSIRVFGSVARRQQRPESDLDLLVELEPHRSLLDLIGFAQDVEEELGVRIDAVTENALSPYLRDRILAEAVLL